MDTGNADDYPSDKYYEENCVIHWIEIYTVNRVTNPLNTPGLEAIDWLFYSCNNFFKLNFFDFFVFPLNSV